MLKRLQDLPHVEAVVPSSLQFGFVDVDGNSQPTDVCSVRVNDHACRDRLMAGRLFESTTEHSAIVTEFLLYRLGLFDEQNLGSALGKILRLEFRQRLGAAGFSLFLVHPDNGEATHAETVAVDKLREQLPGKLDDFDLTSDDLAALHNVLNAAPQPEPAPVTLELNIVGIVRMMNDDEERTWDPLRAFADVLLPTGTAADLYLRLSKTDRLGESLNGATVVVDRDENIKPVVEQITSFGLRG